MSEEIIKKLENHDGQLGFIVGTISKHSETLAEHSKTLAEHSEQLEIIAQTVFEHSNRLDRIERKMESLATKDDHQQIMNAIDKLLKRSNTRDEETSALTYNLRIVDDKVEKHEKDIGQIKTTLGLNQIVNG